MDQIESWVALIVALSTAIYLAWQRIAEMSRNSHLADEQADIEHAKALTETAKTASFFLDTARAQVQEHSRQLEKLEEEIHTLREEMRGLYVQVATLEAENRTLREANEWFKTVLQKYLIAPPG